MVQFFKEGYNWTLEILEAFVWLGLVKLIHGPKGQNKDNVVERSMLSFGLFTRETSPWH